MTRSYNEESLRRHDVSISELNEVLRSPLTITIDLEPSKRGNFRVIWVGFTLNLRLLEIGIEYLPGDKERIFHAMEATKQCRRAFEKEVYRNEQTRNQQEETVA